MFAINNSLPRQLPLPPLAQMAVVLALLIVAAPCQASAIDGGKLGLLWIIPFVGLLLSIAMAPLLVPRFWHQHYGKVALAWVLIFIVPFAMQFGASAALGETSHAIAQEYLPFLILIGALYIISGGICVTGNIHGSANTNLALLAVGTVLASVMGTVGASMLMIRPLLRANDNRKHRVHVVVFFIFLVSNIGGGLTPIGDPPLFIGFLKGVDFFWTVRAMAAPVVMAVALLLIVFYLIDSYYWSHEDALPDRFDPTPDSKMGLMGATNFVLLGGVIAAVLMSGLWKPGIDLNIFGQQVALQNMARDVILLALAAISLKITPQAAHDGNQFSYGPVREVAKLFFGIFITIIPVIAILRSGSDGALAGLGRMVTDPSGQPIVPMYFWLSGGLSAFLDNAPTYLVFFNMAGADPAVLMNQQPRLLTAISAGSVFMGALTYIGNAPNFMVNAIAQERGVQMPSFFGYMLWSIGILVPLFGLLTLQFFR